jgi:hypothetical protein
VTLHLLDAPGVLYAHSVEDPWLSATTPTQDVFGEGDESFTKGDIGSHLYYPDVPANVLGCTTERSYCNPSLPSSIGCIDSRGRLPNSDRDDDTHDVSSLWPDLRDSSFFRPLLGTLSMGTNLDSLHVIPTEPTLLARRTLYASLQMAPLPSDQWQIEQEQSFKAGLAQIQSTVVDFAKGFWIGVSPFCKPGDTCYRGCHSQVRYEPSHNQRTIR